MYLGKGCGGRGQRKTRGSQCSLFQPCRFQGSNTGLATGTFTAEPLNRHSVLLQLTMALEHYLLYNMEYIIIVLYIQTLIIIVNLLVSGSGKIFLFFLFSLFFFPFKREVLLCNPS